MTDPRDYIENYGELSNKQEDVMLEDGQEAYYDKHKYDKE
jgi:hypothetical protein